ncbi:unnamed protein product [Rotaria sp. Silwood1]|nr:unnamed protein product [Rotaria sp. Silwood1]
MISSLITTGKSNQKVSEPQGAAATLKEHADMRPTRLSHARMVQNFYLVWLDESIDETNNKDYHNMIIKLRQVINTVNIFTDVDECIDFITDIKEEKLFMISIGALGQTTATVVHEIAQVHAMYVLCGEKIRHEQWATQWPKVKGVFTDITPICEALKQAAQEYDQNSISLSFVAPSSGGATQNLDQLDPTFMYTQILKEILLSIDFEPKHFVEFITYCREKLAGNIAQLNNIDKLEREYRDHVPIWWYTYHYIIYSMLNRALRTMEVDLIIKMGFFVRDLHEQIVQLRSEQYASHEYSTTFTVFRGQGLSQTDFDQLVKTKGGLMSFNNFLSTSLDRAVSSAFADSNQDNLDLIGVLFQITVDPSSSSTPFANIRDVSYFQGEEEILFSMHSIFRIQQIEQIDNNPRLWQVDIILTSDNDPQLHDVTNSIREETTGSTGWDRLGKLMIKVGQFNQAEELYEILLDETNDERKKAVVYHQLGLVKENQGKYTEAIAFYEKSLEIEQKILPADHPDFAPSYNNIGGVYRLLSSKLANIGSSFSRPSSTYRFKRHLNRNDTISISVLFYLSTCLFGESTGPNIDNVTKSTNKETGGSTYGVVFETADNFFAKQINTHITTVATYLEKQVCFIFILFNCVEKFVIF